MTPIPFHPLVLSMLAPLLVASFVFALYEKDMPASRWLLIAIGLYILPAWVVIDIGFVQWRDFIYWHTCHERSCTGQNTGWEAFVTYSSLAVVEAAALTLVGGLAMLRSLYLRRVYNW